MNVFGAHFQDEQVCMGPSRPKSIGCNAYGLYEALNLIICIHVQFLKFDMLKNISIFNLSKFIY